MSSEANWLEFFEDRERLYATYYLDFAQQHARRAPEAYEQLEVESRNLLKTAAWLAEHNEAEDILKLATTLWQESDFMRSRGFMQRGLSLLEQARDAARQTGDLEAEFICLEAFARVHHETGNPTLAQPLYEEALTLAQNLNKLQFKAKAHLGIGRVLIERGELNQAKTWLKQALQNYRQIQDYVGEIETLTSLGDLLSLQGEFAEARTYLKQGLPLAQSQRDRHSEAALHYALGYVSTNAEDWPEATVHYKAATDIARAIGDHFFEGRGLTALAEAWLALGDAQQAVTLLEEALARQEKGDDILAKAFTHFYLAKAYHFLNEPEKSLAELTQVYPFRQVPVLNAFAAEAAWISADNYLKQRRFDFARTALQDVLDLAPKHMIELRKVAERLFSVIERGDYDSITEYMATHER